MKDGKKSASNALSHHLGQLELTVMEEIWQAPGIDAKTLTAKIKRSKKQMSLGTIQSTVERLFRKELLERVKKSHAYHYEASVSRADLMARLMGDVIQLLHDGKMETILSSFVTVAADLDAASLDRLERLIEEKKIQLDSLKLQKGAGSNHGDA